MRNFKYKIVLLFALLLPYVAVADGVNKETLGRIMELSGLNAQVEQIQSVVVSGLYQARAGMQISDEAFNKIVRAMQDAFHPAVLNYAIGQNIKGTLTERDAQILLSWYQSDLGREIVDAEVKSTTEEAYQEMIGRAQELLSDTQRVDIAKDIDMLTNATDGAIQIQMSGGVAMFVAMSNVLSPGRPVDIDELKKRQLMEYEQSREAMEQMVALGYVYSYKDIDLARLREYIEFLGRDEVVRFHAAVVKGFIQALDQSVSSVKALTAQINSVDMQRMDSQA